MFDWSFVGFDDWWKLVSFSSSSSTISFYPTAFSQNSVCWVSIGCFYCWSKFIVYLNLLYLILRYQLNLIWYDIIIWYLSPIHTGFVFCLHKTLCVHSLSVHWIQYSFLSITVLSNVIMVFCLYCNDIYMSHRKTFHPLVYIIWLQTHTHVHTKSLKIKHILTPYKRPHRD